MNVHHTIEYHRRVWVTATAPLARPARPSCRLQHPAASDTSMHRAHDTSSTECEWKHGARSGGPGCTTRCDARLATRVPDVGIALQGKLASLVACATLDRDPNIWHGSVRAGNVLPGLAAETHDAKQLYTESPMGT